VACCFQVGFVLVSTTSRWHCTGRPQRRGRSGSFDRTARVEPVLDSSGATDPGANDADTFRGRLPDAARQKSRSKSSKPVHVADDLNATWHGGEFAAAMSSPPRKSAQKSSSDQKRAKLQAEIARWGSALTKLVSGYNCCYVPYCEMLVCVACIAGCS
jgi:hypothetical protein